ncbi:MAG: DUF1491 family protein [Rhizobiaceae bacterium]|nr:DUF1491 family protein [Rhizobiaceae bacterium]
MIRVTSVMWFAAFMRRESSRGAFVVAAKRGAQQAGAIFVVHNHLNGNATLFGPAPQAFFDGEESGDRKFERVLVSKPSSEIDQYLEKQVKFDPDLWIIETESGEGHPSLEIVEAP